MPNGNPSAADLITDLRRVHETNPSGETTRNYYREHGTFSEATWQGHFARFSDFLAAAGVKQESKSVETVEYSDQGMTIELEPQSDVRTLEDLIKSRKIDMNLWHCVRFRANEWDMFGQRQYQIKADFTPRHNRIAAVSEIADLLAEAKKKSPKAPKIYRESFMSGNMLEVNVPDVHFGKLAWGGETGFENYDTKIAESIYERAIDGILFRAKGYRFDEVLFIVGNDLLQADDTESRTTSGTVVSTDGRYHKSFRTARRAVIKAIEKCRAIAPVKVIVVPGNHDNLSAWHLGESLTIHFQNYDDVIVENEPTPRKFHQFGNVGLMFCHGHQGKAADYPLQFATERPDIFGVTKYREVHTGHHHKTKLDEYKGVRVRILPALCPPDDWHSQMGFTGNIRSAEGYIWNRDQGLLAIVYHNDDTEPVVNTVSSIVVG